MGLSNIQSPKETVNAVRSPGKLVKLLAKYVFGSVIDMANSNLAGGVRDARKCECNERQQREDDNPRHRVLIGFKRGQLAPTVGQIWAQTGHWPRSRLTAAMRDKTVVADANML